MIDGSYPASISVQAFFSSWALQSMNLRMSGWSALRITIFAARRVLCTTTPGAPPRVVGWITKVWPEAAVLSSAVGQSTSTL